MENVATWKEYLERFDRILTSDLPETPYDNKDYFNYLKLNASRQNRWLKKGTINISLTELISKIDTPQTWFVITEPWCGDAAHSIPWIYLMSQENKNIELKMIWRDTAPFMIENYLTNGGRSVPKLIVRDSEGNDLFTWGPRPKQCQLLYHELKDRNADFEEMKITLQQWYNKDKGESLQAELEQLIKEL
jgi:hypothetical protein